MFFFKVIFQKLIYKNLNKYATTKSKISFEGNILCVNECLNSDIMLAASCSNCNFKSVYRKDYFVFYF